MNQHKTQGAIAVSRENPSTIFVRMAGYVTGALVAQHHDEFQHVLGERPTPY